MVHVWSRQEHTRSVGRTVHQLCAAAIGLLHLEKMTRRAIPARRIAPGNFDFFGNLLTSIKTCPYTEEAAGYDSNHSIHSMHFYIQLHFLQVQYLPPGNFSAVLHPSSIRSNIPIIATPATRALSTNRISTINSALANWRRQRRRETPLSWLHRPRNTR